MSASGGPAADNSNLRAKLEAAIYDALRGTVVPVSGARGNRWADGKPLAAAAAEAVLPVCRLLEAERDKARAELTQRRQLLTEWMDWWEQDDDAPPKLPMALHVRTALTLATPDVIEVAARGVSVPETS